MELDPRSLNPRGREFLLLSLPMSPRLWDFPESSGLPFHWFQLTFSHPPHLCQDLLGVLFSWTAPFFPAHLLLGTQAFALGFLAQSLLSAGTGGPTYNLMQS